jgi:hypothetical protein
VELTGYGSKKQGEAVNIMRGQQGWENDVETQGGWRRRRRLKGQWREYFEIFLLFWSKIGALRTSGVSAKSTQNPNLSSQVERNGKKYHPHCPL